jgi:hypothetical protein
LLARRTAAAQVVFMAGMDLSRIEPFEICSIRPPTENFSLTFRLTRNCGWNRCLFCPVYKQGVKFSRQTMEDVRKDIERARAINDLLTERGVCDPYPGTDGYREAAGLIAEITGARSRSGIESGTGDKRAAAKSGGPSGGDEESAAWFATWFKDAPTIEDSVYHLVSWRLSGGQTCFIGDSNSLVLTPAFFLEAASCIRQAFPTLARFTIYGRTRSAAEMPLHDLETFRSAGLDRIHFGLESGCDEVLGFMKKGVTGEQHILGCRKTVDAGISCGVYVMPGLGGARWSEPHAADTARVITGAAPDYVRLRTLEVFPGTPLAAAVREGTFTEATEEQIVREIRTLVEEIETETTLVSDSASNLLDVSGKLPGDRPRMLEVIDKYLALSPREKLTFSLASRLQSFMGQYGGLTQEIMRAVVPFVAGDSIDTGRASDEEIESVIRLIRSRLMP